MEITFPFVNYFTLYRLNENYLSVLVNVHRFVGSVLTIEKKLRMHALIVLQVVTCFVQKVSILILFLFQKSVHVIIKGGHRSERRKNVPFVSENRTEPNRLNL